MDWAIELIPDEDAIFRRVHKQYLRGELSPSAFKSPTNSLSSNWKRYCPTPEEARSKAAIPADNGVVEFNVLRVRQVACSVTHTPLPSDQSHSDLAGQLKDAETRFKLGRAALLVLPLAT